MVTRIYSPESLNAPADFSLELPIPEGSYPQSNPDGTRPVVTLKVEATSIKFGLSALNQINQGEEILDLIAYNLIGADNYAEIIEEDEDAFAALFSELHEPFLTFTLEATSENEEKLVATLTAPSGHIGYMAFNAMTNEKKLNLLATNFMPLADDEDDEYYSDYDELDDEDDIDEDDETNETRA